MSQSRFRGLDRDLSKVYFDQSADENPDAPPENPWRTDSNLIAAQILAAAGIAGLFSTILLGIAPWLGFAVIGGLSLLLNLANPRLLTGVVGLVLRMFLLATPALIFGSICGTVAFFLSFESPFLMMFLGFFAALGPTLLFFTRRILQASLVAPIQK